MWKYIIVFIFSLFMVSTGCSPATSNSGSSSGGGGGEDGGGGDGTTDDPTGSVTTGSPIYFSLGSQWDALGESETYTEEKTCSTSVNASVGSVTNCDIQMPEAKLYYSNLIFRFGTKSAVTCPIVYFMPYYYKRQNTNAVILGDENATDCTKEDAQCYGGAAPRMITNFPKNVGIVIETELTPGSSTKLKSEFQLKHYRGYMVNYLVTNNSTTKSAAIAYGSVASKIANSWYDYSVECVDYWGEVLHTINITISDENTKDTVGGTQDTYTDWP